MDPGGEISGPAIQRPIRDSAVSFPLVELGAFVPKWVTAGWNCFGFVQVRLTVAFPLFSADNPQAAGKTHFGEPIGLYETLANMADAAVLDPIRDPGSQIGLPNINRLKLTKNRGEGAPCS